MKELLNSVKLWRIAFFSLLLIFVCLLLGSYRMYMDLTQRPPIYVDKEVIKVKTDTVTIVKPKVITQIQLKTDTALLPVIDQRTESVYVQVPITQKIYNDARYTAYVSGYKPSLDSINIYNTTVTVTKTIEQKPKTGGIKIKPSIQAGYGYGLITKNSDIYVGAGVSLTF